MSGGLRLALKAALPGPADLGAITAAGWAECEPAALAARQVTVQGALVAVGDLFTVTGTPGPSLTLAGDLSLASHVGAELAGGLVTVDGSVGAHAGGAAPGAKRGMRGGELVILGDAGPEAGAAMRRGLVAVRGSAGPRTLRSAIAGTLVVGGDAGPDAGLWSKRASLVVLGRVAPSPSYRQACLYQPTVLRMLLRRLRTLGLPITDAHIEGFWRRWSGDFAESGLGEILQWQMN